MTPKNSFSVLIILLIFFTSCEKNPDPVITGITDSYLSGKGAFILNEGNFRAGNGSLSFFSYDSSKVFNHVFRDVNDRPLGDIPYSMNILNEKAYILVNNSGKIEVVSSTSLKSVKTINKINSPRYISFVTAVKAYVTSLYSDSIAILDLTSDAVSGYINLDHSSESIITYDSKAYVANWAGGNEIAVINTAYDQVINSIEVGIEPESMAIDKNGTLWVLCNGGWQRENYAELIGIDTKTDAIIKSFVFPSMADSPTSLQIDSKGETMYFLQNGVRKMGINDSQLPGDSFIDGAGKNFYKLGISPGKDEIFVTDVADYQQKGFLMIYNSNGSLISKMQTDIIPGSICFKLSTILPVK